MGYYSEIGVAMFKEDFEQLLKECKSNPDHQWTYKCLTEYCDHYYFDTWQNWRWNKEHKKTENYGPIYTIVVLHWNFIKAGASDMQYIFRYIREHGGCYAGAGESIGDVWLETYDPPNKDIEVEWYEYIEPQSYVQIQARGEQYENLTDFMEDMDNAAKEISAGRC